MKKRILVLALVLITVLSTVPLAGAADFNFTDVPAYHKDRIAIEYCVNNEFVKGYTDTEFDPDSPLTREQFAVIWGRTYHLRQHNFKDVTRVPNEFENAILIMQALGQVNGISDTEFGRTALISREQAIAITHRAYLPGVDGKDAYKNFADYALISDWAQDSVSACEFEGVLDGVFAGSELRPKQNITRGEICHLIFNIMRKEHDITVVEGITNGTVKIKKTDDLTAVAYPGETIELDIAPDENYVLVSGSLKYNNKPITGTSFTMPFEDVTITAEFAPKLDDIEILQQPKKDAYKVGDTLDLTGLVVQAKSILGDTKNVTGYTTTPAEGTVLSTPGSVIVTVSYTENEIKIEKTFTVQVSSATSS